MRLLIGVPNVWWGGLQSWTTYLAAGLPGEWEVGFAYWNGRDEAVVDLARHGSVFRLEASRHIGGRYDQGALQDSALGLIEDWRPDVVQANCPVLVHGARKAGVPCVTTGHSLRGCGPNGAAIADRAYRVSSAVMGDEPVILNGILPVDVEVARQEHLVVMASRLDRDLNPTLAFNAMRLVHRAVPTVRFRVVGCNHDGSFSAAAKVTEAGLGDIVELCGLLSHEETVRHMAAADVICQPWPEAFGLSVCEAMSAGCIPVVASVGYGPTMVAGGGVCVEGYTVAVVDGLVQALTDERVRGRREANRARVHDLFHARRFAAEYAAAYEEVVCG